MASVSRPLSAVSVLDATTPCPHSPLCMSFADHRVITNHPNLRLPLPIPPRVETPITPASQFSMLTGAGRMPSMSSRYMRNTGSITQRSQQVQLLGPSRPQPAKMWKNKYLKVLVVGDSGLGKTTLIQTLLSKPGENLQVGASLTCHATARGYLKKGRAHAIL